VILRLVVCGHRSIVGLGPHSDVRICWEISGNRLVYGSVVAERSMAAFIRGINVGGHRPVAMGDLRTVFSGLELGDVRTLLQSGNVVFTTSSSAARLRPVIEAACAEQLGLHTTVILRTEAEMKNVVARNPFSAADGVRLHVVFLAANPSAAAVAKLDPERFAPDEWVVDGKHVYVWYPNGAGRSKLRLELGSPATARNWNTVTKMLALMKR
jgi:uncharacterized protein (DUF1697 family)